PQPFYYRLKRYKEIAGYEINSCKFFIKKYLNYFDEAEKEWSNLLNLKKLGFSVPESFFIRRRPDKVEIATFELKGIPIFKLILKEQEKQDILLYKLAELISFLHKQNLYHQDCYLNHFFWDEKTETLGFLDVSRVLANPCFPLKYRVKDLAQLGYSFEEYFGDKGKPYFQKFLSYYLDFSKPIFAKFVRLLVNFKTGLIRRRTEKARAKGKRL
ncbi:MAG: hypothetical protein J7K20_03485, partial [Thermodesulfobacterium sp.]|nr:hypothetical protein [Thermodesulfobacterium sp.]